MWSSHTAEKVKENEKVTILLDMPIYKYREIKTGRPDIVVKVIKENCFLIYISIPNK